MAAEERASALGGSLLLPLIHSIAWSESVEIRRDAAQGLASLSNANENRITIAKVGGFAALLSCLHDSDDTTQHDPRSPAATSSTGVYEGSETSNATSVSKLTTIVSMKTAAKRALKRSRHYAIKRLAIESISNLLEERENHELFLTNGGMETFKMLIQERNMILVQEQKRISHALYHLCKNEHIRKRVYEHRFMDIVLRIVSDGESDLVHSILRALRLLTTPIVEQVDKNGGDTGTRLAPRIPWTGDDLGLFSSILTMRSLDVKQFKLTLDIMRNVGAAQEHATKLIKKCGPELLTRFFEAAISRTYAGKPNAVTDVIDSSSRCIAAMSRHHNDGAEEKGSPDSSRATSSHDIYQLQQLLGMSINSKEPAQSHAEKLRCATRALLDICSGCCDAKAWMSHQEFVVALLQIVRTKDIVAVRCASAILAELTSRATVIWLLPHMAYIVESVISMETDLEAQLSILRVLEIMCREDKEVVKACSPYTAELINVCERLVRHSGRVDGPKGNKCVIAFALALSFDTNAKLTLQTILPNLKYIQQLLQGNDAAIKDQTVHFIHNVYSFDQNVSIRLAADSIWFMKKYARARSHTEAGMKASEIAKHHEKDLAAQTIQRFYRFYRGRKYMSRIAKLSDPKYGIFAYPSSASSRRS